MEPITYITTAGTTVMMATKVGTALYSFCQSTKDVDETIKGLHSGVDQVGHVCRLIEKQVKRLPQPHPDDSDAEDLFQQLQSQLSGCLAVIYRIDSKIDPIRQNKTGIVRQAYRQLRLNMNQADINECRTQIQTGVQNLQLSLQLLVLQTILSGSIPSYQALLGKLDEIQRMLSIKGVDKDLEKCAHTYVSKGNTLYEKSVASSEVGGNIVDWVDYVETQREEGLSSSNPQSLHTEETKATSISNEEDDEYDLVIQMIQQSLGFGKVAYKNATYLEAEESLRDCLALIEKLPEYRCQDYDLDEISLLLAICTFHNHSPEVAEAMLTSTLESQSNNGAHLKTKFEALSSLAIVYVRLGKLDLAESTCMSVYRGRRKSSGEDFELSWDSLALLVRIYELQDLHTRARNVRSMINQDKQDTFCERYSNLSCDAQASLVVERNASIGSSVNKWSCSLDDQIYTIALSMDSNTIACALYQTPRGRNGIVQLRSIHDYSLLHTLMVEKETTAYVLAFDQSGKNLATGHGGYWYDGMLKQKKFNPISFYIWDVETGNRLRKLTLPSDQTNLRLQTLWLDSERRQLLFSYRVDGFASATKGKLAPGFMVLDIQSGSCMWRLDCGVCWMRAILDDGRALVYTKDEVKLLDTKDHTAILEPVKGNDTLDVVPDSDGALIVLHGNGKIDTHKNGHVSSQQLDFRTTATSTTRYAKGSMFITEEGNLIVTLLHPDEKSLHLITPTLGWYPPLNADGETATIDKWLVSSDSKYLVWTERRPGFCDTISARDISHQLQPREQPRRADSTLRQPSIQSQSFSVR